MCVCVCVGIMWRECVYVEGKYVWMVSVCVEGVCVCVEECVCARRSVLEGRVCGGKLCLCMCV